MEGLATPIVMCLFFLIIGLVMGASLMNMAGRNDEIHDKECQCMTPEDAERNFDQCDFAKELGGDVGTVKKHKSIIVGIVLFILIGIGCDHLINFLFAR